MIRKRMPFVIMALLMMLVTAEAQTQRQGETFSVQGYPGQAPVIHLQGRALVDVQDLTRITNGTLSFEQDRIILTLSRGNAPDTADDELRKSRFSRPFMRAAIEAMASVREWAGLVMITVQNGYPVGNNMAGNTINAYQSRAAESIALASSVASNDADQRGVELLRNGFNTAQAWSERFVKARSSLSATNMTITENAFQNDQEAQKIVHCGQFLAQMFAGGVFQDDASCH
jgi:hypothetical protein